MENNKAAALGALLIACSRLDNTKTGQDKISKALGNQFAFRSENGKKFFYSIDELSILTVGKLSEMTFTVNQLGTK